MTRPSTPSAPSAPSAPSVPFSESSLPRWLLAAVLSLVLHLLAVVAAALVPKATPQPVPPKLTFRLLQPKPPPPPPPAVVRPPAPRPEIKPPPRPKPRLKPKPRKRTPPRRPPPPPPPPHRSAPPPRPSAEPPKPVFGVTMQSLSQNAGAKVAVRVGNTLLTDPGSKIVPPSEVKPYHAPPTPPPDPTPRDTFAPVPVFEVDENPSELQKSRASYPVEAKREGIQAVVILSVEIRASGRVRGAKVISVRPDAAKRFDFGKAAIAALKKYRFRPARYQGRPVDVVVRYIYRFELND